MEWVANPGCAWARFSESHSRKEGRFTHATFELVTIPKLKMKYQTDVYPDRMGFVNQLIAGAVDKPTWHPQCPKDVEWKKYRILKHM
eukprot:6153459-Heterocapsa_arctica.AAC.1